MKYYDDHHFQRLGRDEDWVKNVGKGTCWSKNKGGMKMGSFIMGFVMFTKSFKGSDGFDIWLWK